MTKWPGSITTLVLLSGEQRREVGSLLGKDVFASVEGQMVL